MCCPYFDPVAPRARVPTAQTAMLPLGELWDGICRANPLDAITVDDAALGPVCNLGYARDTCSRFPPGDSADAVRFAIAGDAAGGSGQSGMVTLRYAVESGHYPLTVGTLECPRDLEARTDMLASQTRAYLASYRRRIREAAAE